MVLLITVNKNALLSDSMAKYIKLPDTISFTCRGKDTFWFKSNFNPAWVMRRDRVILQIGTVDVLKLDQYGSISDSTEPAELARYGAAIAESILDIVSIIRSYNPYAVIVVSGILPIPCLPHADPLLNSLNHHLSSSFKTSRATIFLDSPKTFIAKQHLSYEQLFPDGIHIARPFRKFLRNKFQQALTPSFISENLNKQRKTRNRRNIHAANLRR